MNRGGASPSPTPPTPVAVAARRGEHGIIVNSLTGAAIVGQADQKYVLDTTSETSCHWTPKSNYDIDSWGEDIIPALNLTGTTRFTIGETEYAVSFNAGQFTISPSVTEIYSE